MKKLSIISLIILIGFIPFKVNSYCFDKLEISNLTEFLYLLGHKESTNNYQCINKFGYLGKYQFSPKTLKSLGYNISNKDFLNNPSIQEEAISDLIKENNRILNKHIIKYNNKTINNVLITKSGILAAAHLSGPYAVKKYLDSKGTFNKLDGLGTSIEEYMILFSNKEI
jgi:hypothetical protein